VAGALGSNVVPTANVLTTILTSASLAIGTWLVTFNVSAASGTVTNAELEIKVAAGTATCTFAGASAASMYLYTTYAPYGAIGVSCLVTVTVAGTLLFQAETSGPTGDVTLFAVTPIYYFPNATGYTATRVA
jgi:hypothetical protein